MERVKYQLEFIFKASPSILYQFITTPSCLVRWFCDDVDITGEHFSFGWSGAYEDAELVDSIEDERLRFQWEDGEDNEFLDFKMYHSPITNETILEVSDYCDSDEVDEQKSLWESQIKKLRTACGG